MRVSLMWSANLIVHQGIADFFHQGINPLDTLRIVEKLG